MIKNYSSYELYYMAILDKVGFLRVDTLKDCLFNYVKMFKSFNETEYYLWKLAETGHVIISKDGWCMSKKAYQRFSIGKDIKDKLLHKQVRLDSIDDLSISENDMDIADCMILVSDMMPLSDNFILGASPWYIQFIAKDKNEEFGRLFQITTFRDGKEMAMGEIISTLPVTKDEDFRNQIRRIAILDNPNMSWTVPHLGFSYTCWVNPENRSRLEIIEDRTETDMWSDYVKE